ncbi:hypothetical protein [Arthrobacter sp. STN4]|uniref:hypothetical protein n=1 Tax=Arthrobacter sp. STN4 TaxID=2923276 RepID=UPI002119E81F|nr:hypothetical protein [Arthrobacter sp. STN4]MCQ9162951.1 hypothetical protein [Arthrobacter sp. STN4]
MALATTGFNATDWQTHYDLIWGRHDYPEDALLTVNWLEDNGMMPSIHVPLADPDAVWEVIQRVGKDRAAYIGIAPRMPIVLEAKQNGRWRRGKKSEVYPIPAIFADIDVRSGTHKSDNLPTWEEADQWLRDFPLKPTILFNTGGGYHAWWALDELPTADEQAEMLLKTKRWWLHRAEQDGKHFDGGVLEPLRILRAGGSLIGKNGNLNPISIVEVN